MSNELAAIGKVEKLSGVSRSVQAFRHYVEQNGAQTIPTDRGYFESLMRLEKKPEVAATNNQDQAIKPSLMDEVAKANKRVEGVQKASTVDLIEKAQKAISQIDELKAQLNTPELQLKAGVQKLLKGKLSAVNDDLKVAFSKAGLEYIPPERQFGTKNPVKKFLSYLADGQGKLESLAGHVDGLARSGQDLTPAQLMSVQLKVNHIQQELEFFSGLLNKVLESTKTVMNVQV